LNHRFYGFLIHPKSGNQRFQICILVVHAKKQQQKTDETCLEQVESMRINPMIQEFIKDYFGERP
jgi:hypothetical protein